MALRIASGLRPDRQPMGLDADGYLSNGAGRGIEIVDLAIEAAGQPQLFAIGADIAHVGAAAAGYRPSRNDGAGCEIDDRDASRSLGAGTIHPLRSTVRHVELGSIAADGKAVGPHARGNEADFLEAFSVD